MLKRLIPILLIPLFLLSACTTAATPDTSAAAGTDASPETTAEMFRFTRENFPRMDGSTATIPLGQAVASVLLGEPREDVAGLAVFSKTTQSFRNLMNGETDILIVGEPNADVFDEMKKADFDYEMAVIATDALVFIVNASNPVDGLTTEQVQKIYTGEITNWKDVGGPDLKIEAFQRNETAGSQALMKKLVMKDLTMADPPEGYTIGEMEGLIAAVRSFDGSAQAIGYTVYYYADDMHMADGLKILSIDGTAPNDETIAAGEYPFLNPYYAVIPAQESAISPARILYGWLQSPEGQALIEREGYVPAAG